MEIREVLNSRTVHAFIILLLANAIAIGVVLWVPSEEIGVRTWLTAIPAMAGLVAYLRLRSKGEWTVSWDTMATAGTIVAFMLPSLAISVVSFSDTMQADVGSYVPLLPEVALAALVGQTFFLLGYAVTPGVEDQEHAGTRGAFDYAVAPAQFFGAFGLILLASWLARLALLAFGSYYHQLSSGFMWEQPTLYSAMIQVAQLGFFVLAGVWIQAFAASDSRQAKSWYAWAGILSLADLVWYLPTGGRESVLMVFVVALSSYVFVKRRVPTAVTLAIVPLLVGLILFLGVYREVIREDAGSASAVDTREVAASVTSSRGRVSDLVDAGGAFEIAVRPSEFRPVAAIMDAVPDSLPYLGGETYLNAIWILVPRAVYPDKPLSILPINQWLFQNEGGSSPVTLIGEGYFNFGWPGICGALFVTGLICARFDRASRRRTYSGSRWSFIWASFYVGTAVTVLRLYSQPLSLWIAVLLKAFILAWLTVRLTSTFGRQAPSRDERLFGWRQVTRKN